MSCKSGDLYRSLDGFRAATELGLAQHIVAFRLLSAIAHPSGDVVAHIFARKCALLIGSQRSPRLILNLGNRRTTTRGFSSLARSSCF